MTKLLRFLVALLCTNTAGCASALCLEDISRVSYTEISGTILQELQLHEQLVITREKVTLARRGMVEPTMVKAGVWELEVDEGVVQALFAQLAAVDCSSIRRTAPEELHDGGGTRSYEVLYGGGQKLRLVYGGGATYTGGQQVVDPIREFIAALRVPSEAALQYSLPPD